MSIATLRSALGSFDLGQPPAVGDPNAVSTAAGTSFPELVVRVDRDRFVVRHWDGETLIARPNGGAEVALAALHRTLADRTRALGTRANITVVPSDDVLYDDLVRVLDEVRRVEPRGVALGTRARR